MPSSVLLRHEDYGVEVRVRPGWTLQGTDDLAPSVRVTFAEDEVLSLAVEEAVPLIDLGAVEAV